MPQPVSLLELIQRLTVRTIDVPVITPFALAIVESPAMYTVCARFETSPLGAASAVAAHASTETTCEYNMFAFQIS
jgi:hypothetical protein